MDSCLISLAYNKYARIYVSNTTNLVQEAKMIHDTWPTATAAFGRFLTVSAMMGLMYKGDENITLQIKSDGDIKQMIVKANTLGEVCGDILNPHVYYKYEDGLKKGKLNVGKAVGNGFLNIVKDLKMKDNFTSQIRLQTGEIADDFTYYFATSEQTPSSVGLGVLVDTNLNVKSSGGYILQLLPGCPDEVIDKIENTIKNIEPISKLISEGNSSLDILKLLSNNDYEIIEEKKLSYHCDCSKERFYKALQTLDNKSLEEMLDTDTNEIVCNFCKKKYYFNKDDINNILLNKNK